MVRLIHRVPFLVLSVKSVYVTVALVCCELVFQGKIYSPVPRNAVLRSNRVLRLSEARSDDTVTFICRSI